MSKKLDIRSSAGSKGQEFLMREVLEGLEEVATMLSYDPWPGEFEIIAIYPPEQEDARHREETVIKSPPERPKADVISYQERKDLMLKLSA